MAKKNKIAPLAKASDPPAPNPGDLYAILGVARDATDDQLREGWRRMKNNTHPDRGGDRINFDRVNFAYEVLSDPARREKYDRTGTADPTRPDNSEVEAVTVLTAALMNVIEQVCQQGARIEQQNMQKHLTEWLTQNLANMEKTKKVLSRMLVALEETAKRFVLDPKKENLLERACLNQVADIRGKLAGIELDLQRLRNAQAYLKTYSYRYDEAQSFRSYTSTTTATSW